MVFVFKISSILKQEITLTCEKVPYFVEKSSCKICILTCRNVIFGVLGVFAGYFHKDLVQKTLKDYIYVHVEFAGYYRKI